MKIFYLNLFILLVITDDSFAARGLYKKKGGGSNKFGNVILGPRIPAILPEDQGQGHSFQIQNGFQWNYFGDTGLNEVYVHYNGFIVFDQVTNQFYKDSPKQSCQNPPNDVENMLAVYWVKYDQGTVHAFRHTDSQKTLSNGDLIRLVTDLSNTFEKPVFPDEVKPRPAVTTDEIEDVLVITWYDMFTDVNTLTLQNRRHRFQALLIKVVDKEDGKTYQYVQYYYAQLGSNGNWNPSTTLNPQPCQRAEFGVSVTKSVLDTVDTQGHGIFSTGFFLPSVAETLSNENTFGDLGSWVFDVSGDDVLYQPVPLAGNCVTFNPLDPKCYLHGFAERKRSAARGVVPPTDTPITDVPTTLVPTSTPDTPEPATSKPTQTTRPATTKRVTDTYNPDVNVSKQTQEFANKFCKYRDAGIYPIPIICDVFVSCSLGGVATPLVCPEGTNFNPEFLTCDWADNFECYFEKANLSQITNVVAPEPKHNNLCHYHGFGNFIDPNSCDNYYACTNSRSILMPCPAGLYFKPMDETSGHCDWPYNVKCRGKGDRTDEYHPRNIY